MNVTDAVDLINKTFLDAWIAAGYSSANVRWNDVPSPTGIPTGQVVWARVTIRHSDGYKNKLGPGANTHSNTGTVWVQTFTPIGAGTPPGYPVADCVVKAFRNSKSDVWFRNARMKEVGSSGAFEQINVLADFTYDN